MQCPCWGQALPALTAAVRGTAVVCSRTLQCRLARFYILAVTRMGSWGRCYNPSLRTRFITGLPRSSSKKEPSCCAASPPPKRPCWLKKWHGSPDRGGCPLVTPSGYAMSGAMTTIRARRLGLRPQRYRYDPIDPDTGAPWLAMPAAFLDLAVLAAAEAEFLRTPQSGARRVGDRVRQDSCVDFFSIL